MSDAVKVRYEVDLSTGTPDLVLPFLEIRALIPTDREALAGLMLDAYVGTIDYEGETLTGVLEEVDSWLAGTPMLDHSCGAIVDGRLVSAVLVMVLDEAPFISFVMTDPDHKGHRFGRAVTHAALESLRAVDYPFAALYITKGNTPSERLFAAVGAKPTATDTRPQRHIWVAVLGILGFGEMASQSDNDTEPNKTEVAGRETDHRENHAHCESNGKCGISKSVHAPNPRPRSYRHIWVAGAQLRSVCSQDAMVDRIDSFRRCSSLGCGGCRVDQVVCVRHSYRAGR